MNKKYFRQPLNAIGAALMAVTMCLFSNQIDKAANESVDSPNDLSVRQRVFRIRQQVVHLSSKDSNSDTDPVVDPTPWDDWNDWGNWNNWSNWGDAPPPSPSPSDE